jgi:REP element-mobilizing transposase RayT
MFKSPSKTIGAIIRGFKIGVTKWVKENQWANNYLPLQCPQSIWQRNYYEHVIRNSRSYQIIADYILENPENWLEDDYYN